MTITRRTTIPGALAAVLAASACTKEPATDTGATAGGGNTTASGGGGAEPQPPGFDRVVREELAPIGRQPGYIADGLMYAAIRPQRAVAWLRKIPLPAEAGRELAELARESGVDWRAEDLERRFALAKDGVISMTFFRPITTGAREVRGELARGGKVLQAMPRVYGEVTGQSVAILESPKPIDPLPLEKPPIEAPPPPEPPAPPKAPPPPSAPTSPPISPPISPPPLTPEIAEVVPPEPPPIPVPPPIAEETLAEAKDALRRASGLGLHSRVVVQVTDPEPLVQWMRGHAPASAQARMDKLCPSLPQSRLCIADDEFAAVVRSDAGTVTIDFLMFALDTNDLTEAQSTAIRSAIDLKAIETGGPTELRGDAAGELAAAPIVALAEIDGIRRALSGIRWGDSELDETVRNKLEGIEAIERLASAPMLFTAARLEAGIGADDRLQAELRWVAAPDRRADNDALLGAIVPKAPVPSIAGLCDGAVACVRTRGVPKPSSLSDRLATGAWAARPNEFEDTFEKNEELAVLQLVAASWPNLLGAVARWPALEVGDGPEGAMVRNLVDVIGRIEGFGGSLRNFSIGHRNVQADYVLYARTSAADAGIVRGFLSLAQQSMTEITLAGVQGSMFSYTVPEDDFPATLVSRADPAASGAAQPELGWIAVVDGADRMGWLLGLPQEPPQGPPAYFEIPDLARALPTVPEIERELGFLRGFFGGLQLRAMLEVDAGEPRITAVLSRSRP